MTSWNLRMVIDHDLSVSLLDAPWSHVYEICCGYRVYKLNTKFCL